MFGFLKKLFGTEEKIEAPGISTPKVTPTIEEPVTKYSDVKAQKTIKKPATKKAPAKKPAAKKTTAKKPAATKTGDAPKRRGRPPKNAS